MTPDIAPLFEAPVHGLPQREKEALLLPALTALTAHHQARCAPYAAILAAIEASRGARPVERLADLPFIPVRLFKLHVLESIPPEARFKVLSSSGTTGQAVSRVTLDRATASYQTRAMVRILQDFLGKDRLPMLIVDHPDVIRDRASFSARGAGILGLSNFGRAHVYALAPDTMGLDLHALRTFAEAWRGQPVLLFGFTFMVWKYLVQALEVTGERISLPDGVLVHSGGWKKLVAEAVGPADFASRLEAVTGIRRVHDFYGMAEQVGSIFVACEAGRLHVPAFAEVIVRRPEDWSEAAVGEEGVIEVLSCLPHSYPGHALLTEDLGAVLGVDDCPCGRLGRTFRVVGRVPQAEVRGCSDTFGEGPARG
jgi:hypothetical protein